MNTHRAIFYLLLLALPHGQSTAQDKSPAQESILVRLPESNPEVHEIIHTQTIIDESDSYIITQKNGISLTLPKKEIILSLPKLNPSSGTLRSTQIQDIITSYNNALKQLPQPLIGGIKPDLISWEQLLTSTLAIEEKQIKEHREKTDAWLAESYQTAFSYPLPEVQNKISEGLALANSWVDYKKEQIRSELLLWDEEQKQLLAGMVKGNGVWRPKEEHELWGKNWKENNRKELFETKQAITPGSEVLDYNHTQWILYSLAGLAAILVILVMFGLYGLRSGLGIMGLLCLGTTFIMLPILSYYAYALTMLPPDAKQPEESEVAPDIDSLKSDALPIQNFLLPLMTGTPIRTKDLPDTLVFGEKQINAFLATSVSFKPKQTDTSTPSSYDLTRQSWQVQFNKDHILLIENARWMAIPLLLSYKIPYSFKDTVKPIKTDQIKIHLGSTKAPSDFASTLSSKFLQDMASSIEQSKILNYYRLDKINPGTIHLTKLQK